MYMVRHVLSAWAVLWVPWEPTFPPSVGTPQASASCGINRAHATLDQMGGVCSFRTGNDKMPYLNVAFNYQKKKNFNNAFIADNDHLNGLSQMTQLADLVNAGYDTDHNLAGWAVDNLYLTPLYKDANGVLTPQQPHEGAEPSQYVNKYQGELNRYTQKTWGSLNAFDFNL